MSSGLVKRNIAYSKPPSRIIRAKDIQMPVPEAPRTDKKSVGTGKIMNNRNGVTADVKYASPDTNNTQNVNLVFTVPTQSDDVSAPAMPMPLPSIPTPTYYPPGQEQFISQGGDYVPNQAFNTMTRSVDVETTTRDVEVDPQETYSLSQEHQHYVNHLNEVIHNKDNIISALSMMLLIIENNPLIISKKVIAKKCDLEHLIKLLTGATSVQIDCIDDFGCGCGISNKTYVPIDKIWVLNEQGNMNFKYSYPDANKILTDHHISLKLCILTT